MKWVARAVLAAITVAGALAATPAQASRILLSLSATSPVAEITAPSGLQNPSLILPVGANGSLYLWWQPTLDTQSGQNENMDGWSHDIVSSNPILSMTSYVIDNPTIPSTTIKRWDSTGTGTGSATFMIDNANAVKPGGSTLGFIASAPPADTYDPVTQTWRMSTINFHADSAGVDNIFLAIGAFGISFVHTGGVLPINFGFGDAAIQSNAFGSETSTADATVTVISVPEPSTLALIASGAAGLFLLARRRARTSG